MEVKWFQDKRGFGFIKYQDKERIIVHYSVFRDGQDDHELLEQDEYIEVELVKTDKGYKIQKATSTIKEEK